MPSPTNAVRIIIYAGAHRYLLRARHLKLLCRRSARINTYSAGVGAPTVRGPTLKIRGEELRNDFFVCADLTVRFHQLTDRTRNIYA